MLCVICIVSASEFVAKNLNSKKKLEFNKKHLFLFLVIKGKVFTKKNSLLETIVTCLVCTQGSC